MVRTAVLVSGNGTNLQSIINAHNFGRIKNCRLAAVISSKPDAYALERAKSAGIPTFVIDYKHFPSREGFNEAIYKKLVSLDVELVVLAGFLVVLGSPVVEAFKNRIINIHPSLVPAFCGEGLYGLRVHQAALNYGVKLSGATVHFASAVADAGPSSCSTPAMCTRTTRPSRCRSACWRRPSGRSSRKPSPCTAKGVCTWRGALSASGRPQYDAARYKSRARVQYVSRPRHPSGPQRGRGARRPCLFHHGRSENSRNRVFVKTDDGIRTEAFDPSKMTDPTLIIYHPVRIFGDTVLVTNGDQTDTLRARRRDGRFFLFGAPDARVRARRAELQPPASPACYCRAAVIGCPSSKAWTVTRPAAAASSSSTTRRSQASAT